MGRESTCIIRRNGDSAEAKVLLEGDELVVRGAMRMRVPFASLTAATARAGVLTLKTAQETVSLELGDLAASWLEKIQNPRTRMDKLGVKPGAEVSVLGDAPADFLAELEKAGAEVTTGRAKKGCTIVFLITDSARSLDKLQKLGEAIAPDGSIWVVHPRGRKDFADTHVFAAAMAAGLVDVKVARFSETHTAEKLVIPVAKRKKRDPSLRSA